MEPLAEQQAELKKSCVNCGAELRYAPGTEHLKCGYCGHESEIEHADMALVELDLKQHMEQFGKQSHREVISMIQCKSCGANQHIEENYKSLHCVYCHSPLITEDIHNEEWILPGAVLPFQLDQNKAHKIFQKWVNGLWFAPNKLKKATLDPQYTKGLYVPYWTFDAQLYADYTGKRGEYYYVTKTVGSGKNRRTVTERRTRWYPAAGSVSGFVDDTLIKASHQRAGVIPKKIAHWNLQALKPFDSSYLAGFVTEKYTIPLNEGHLDAKDEALKIADRWARVDIGGDTQQVHSLDMELSEETFKHILLPVFVSSYRFKGKQYNFFVNGQTGRLSGKRPYSFWKIFFFVLAILAVIALIVFFVNQNQ